MTETTTQRKRRGRRRFPELMTVDQAAEFLGIGRSTLYELQAINRLPAPVTLGKTMTRWAKSDLLRWVEWGSPRREDYEAMRQTQSRNAGLIR